jgi:hypothetical protein
MDTKQDLTLFPTPFQKEENLLNHPQQAQQLQQQPPTDQTTNLPQHHPLPKQNITATAKCKLTIENAVTNANLLSKKPTAEPGLCTSLKTLDRRLDEMFDSPEVTHAFSVLQEKMEKDFKTKQLKKDSVTYVFRTKQLEVDYDDTRMYFDTRDNYVSPKIIRARFKQVCNTNEYLEAKKSLLLNK